jgi:hypothetical protein
MAIDQSLYGTFNLTGKPMSFREFLEACKSRTRSDAKFTWIPRDFLHEHGLESDAVPHICRKFSVLAFRPGESMPVPNQQ